MAVKKSPKAAVEYPAPVMFDLGDAVLVCIPDARGERSESAAPNDFVRPQLDNLGNHAYNVISASEPAELIQSPVPVDRDLVKQQLAAAGPGLGTVYVMFHAGQIILFDSGLGSKCGDPGRLSAALGKAGISPGEITQLWLSEIEPRKFGANIKKAPELLNAHLFFSRLDLDDSAAKKHFGKNRTAFIQGADTFDKYLSYERCMTLTGGTVVPHVPLPEGKRLAFLGDAIPFPSVQFGDLGLISTREETREEAVSFHQKILDFLSRPEFLVAARTLPFPGVGTITNDGGKYAYTPTDRQPVPATPEAIAEVRKKNQADASPSHSDGAAREVVILIRNQSSINVTVDGDPNWDDQILLFNDKEAKKSLVLKPGKEMTVTKEGPLQPNELLIGMSFIAPGYSSFTFGNGSDGLLGVTESFPLGVSFTVADQTPTSFTLIFSDSEKK